MRWLPHHLWKEYFQEVFCLLIPAYLPTEPDKRKMHVTRPKSAKARSRPNLNYTKTVDAVSYDNVPVMPRPPSSSSSELGDSPFRPQSSPRPLSIKTQHKNTTLVQQFPARPSSSLNRYRVLPSIEKRGSGDTAIERLEKQTRELSMSSALLLKKTRPFYKDQPTSGRDTNKEKKPGSKCYSQTEKRDPGLPHISSLQTPSDEQPSLLLAVRSPSGERFEKAFCSSDTLQTVLAAAEARYNTTYTNGIVETMEVPRRSFPDSSHTLEQCGIQNKSVLCILDESDYQLYYL
ncbi:UBX domain-containing protein 10-like [Polyodon spathula]|uniref:UBX domain-containing protein 10-like n=1 Tax=Polyodon spathula TaxID=7913 RepID=UPI001B7E694B|nr:UBX domain-containing protein 10-like [Polyodon spathula]XP_041130249.1 UBX domain-containing protein 10-like [Polyodon spathula]